MKKISTYSAVSKSNLVKSMPVKANVSGTRTSSSTSTLGRAQEMEVMKEISELEKTLWKAFLINPCKVRFVLERITSSSNFDAICESAPEMPVIIEGLLDTDSIRRGRSSQIKQDKAYENYATQLVDCMLKADMDRDLAREAVLVALERGQVRRSAEPGLCGYGQLVFSVNRQLTEIRDRFIEANQGLVVLIANRYGWTHMPLSDLIQEGNLGLIKAVNRFDYTKGYQFSTYASWWIQSAIGRAIDNKESIIRIPSSAMRNRSRLKKAVRTIQMQTGRTPTDDEIRSETGMGRLRLERAKRNAIGQIYSLDQEVSDSNSLRYSDILIDHSSQSPFDETMIGTMTKMMATHLQSLTQLEKSILARRFGLNNADELTLQEIADQYGLSRERIRQIQNRALSKLREKMSLDAA